VCRNLTTNKPGVVCTASCDPSTNAGCLSTEACRVFEENASSTQLSTYCGGVGTKVQGKACTVNSNCKTGFECVSSGSGADCEQLCDPDNDMCPPPYACNSFGLPLGANAVGSCE
jgi:hypothetical protein